MTTLLTIAPQRVLADLIVQPTTRVRAIVRDVLLVVGFALLTAAAAQIEIQLGFTPVPLTGQTFAVLLSGAVLGMRRGALSQLVYWMAGLTGLPFTRRRGRLEVWHWRNAWVPRGVHRCCWSNWISC